MSFPTVKSDPWKKKPPLRPKRNRHLWTSEQWGRLCKLAAETTTRRPDGTGYERSISEACIILIREFNLEIV
jgi:hypothetical protein